MNRTFKTLIGIAAVLVGAAILFVAVAFAADHVSAAMPQIQQSVAAAKVVAASNVNQAQDTNPCGSLAADGSSDIASCASWLWNHGYREKLWNWIYNSGLNFCVTQPGVPVKHFNPPTQPTPPSCNGDCQPIGNPQDGSKTP